MNDINLQEQHNQEPTSTSTKENQKIRRKERKRKLKDAENQERKAWADNKVALRTYRGRKERRYLRMQTMIDQRDRWGYDCVPSKPQLRFKPQPVVLHKGVQTDAYVIMDTTIADTDKHVTWPQELNVSTLISAFQQKATETSFVQQNIHDIEEIKSSNSLPPATPCLAGTCRFATELCKSDPAWLGCHHVTKATGKRCHYWVHAKCYGFPNMTQSMVKLTKGFRCQQHLK